MKLKFTLLLLTSSSVLNIALGQSADTSAIQQIDILENRLQIPFNKHSRNIEVITANDIKKMPVRTLNEVLSQINGIDLRQRGPFGTQADIGIDGGSFEQTLILLNGVKILDPQTAHHNLNLPIPLDAIERIEVLRGPASRIYGINGLTGSINIVTKTAESDNFSIQQYAGSSFKDVEEEEGRRGIYYGESTELSGQIVRNDFRNQFYLTRQKSNGQRYNSAAENYKVYYQGDASVDANNQLQWSGGYISNSFGANGFYASPGDRESEEIVKTTMINLKSVHQIGRRFVLTPGINYRKNKDDYRYIRQNLDVGRSEHATDVYAIEVNGRYHTDFGDFGIGAESRFENISSTNIGEHKRQNHGYSAEFRTENINNILLNVGTYINYNSKYGVQVFPGVDFSYLFGNRWSLSVNAGSSQRIPSFTDLFLNQAPGNIGNPELKTENAWQAESLLKFDSGNFRAQAGVFYRNINNFIDWQRPNDKTSYQPVNLDKNEVRGINVSGKYFISTENDFNYSIGLAYTYLDPTAVSSDGSLMSKYAIESLAHQMNSNISVMYRNTQLTTTNRYIDRLSGTDYFISDLRVAQQIQHFLVFADLTNLFDVIYTESGAVPMPGRWMSLGLRYQWKN